MTLQLNSKGGKGSEMEMQIFQLRAIELLRTVGLPGEARVALRTRTGLKRQAERGQPFQIFMP